MINREQKQLQNYIYYYQKVQKLNNTKRKYNDRIIEYKRNNFELSYISQLNKRAKQQMEHISTMEQQSFGNPKCLLPIYFVKKIEILKTNQVKLTFIKGKTSAYFQDGYMKSQQTMESFLEEMLRTQKLGLFEPDPKKECEWFFRFEKDSDAQLWYDMFIEDLTLISEQFRKMKIMKGNQLRRQSTIMTNQNQKDLEAINQEYQKYGRIKPLVIDDSEKNQFNKNGQVILEQKEIRKEMFQKELEKKNIKLIKMQKMDKYIKQQKNNMELKFQYIMYKAFKQNNKENINEIQRLDKLKYITQLNHIISIFKEQCYKAVKQIHPQILPQIDNSQEGNNLAFQSQDTIIVKKQITKGLIKMTHKMEGVDLEIRCLWPYKVISSKKQEVTIFNHHIKKIKNRFKSNEMLLKYLMEIQMNDTNKVKCDELHSVPLSMIIKEKGFIYYVQSNVLKQDDFSVSELTHGLQNVSPKVDEKIVHKLNRRGVKNDKNKDAIKKIYKFVIDQDSEIMIQKLGYLLKYQPCMIEIGDEQQKQEYNQYLSHDLRIYKVKNTFKKMNIQNQQEFTVKYMIKTQNLLPISIDIDSEQQQNKNNKMRPELLELQNIPLNPNSFMHNIEEQHEIELCKANKTLRNSYLKQNIQEIEEFDQKYLFQLDGFGLPREIHKKGLSMNLLGKMISQIKAQLFLKKLEYNMVLRVIKMVIENNLVQVQIKMSPNTLNVADFYADQLNLLFGLSGASQKDQRFMHAQETKKFRLMLREALLNKFEFEMSLDLLDNLLNYNTILNEYVQIYLNISFQKQFSHENLDESFYFRQEHIVLVDDYDQYELYDQTFLTKMMQNPIEGYKSQLQKVIINYQLALMKQSCLSPPCLRMQISLINTTQSLVSKLIELKDFQAAQVLIPHCFFMDPHGKLDFNKHVNLRGRGVELEYLIQLAHSYQVDQVWISQGKATELRMQQALEEYKQNILAIYPNCSDNFKFRDLRMFQVRINKLTLENLPQLYSIIEQQRIIQEAQQNSFGNTNINSLKASLNMVYSQFKLHIYDLSQEQLTHYYQQGFNLLYNIFIVVQNFMKDNQDQASIEMQDIMLESILGMSSMAYIQGHFYKINKYLAQFQIYFNKFQFINKNRFQNNFHLCLFSSNLLISASAIRIFQIELRQKIMINNLEPMSSMDLISSQISQIQQKEAQKQQMLLNQMHSFLQQMETVLKQLWPILIEQLSLCYYLNENLFDYYINQFLYLLSHTIEHYFNLIKQQMRNSTKQIRDQCYSNIINAFNQFQKNKHKKSSQFQQYCQNMTNDTQKQKNNVYQAHSIYPESNFIRLNQNIVQENQEMLFKYYLIRTYFINFDNETNLGDSYFKNSQDNLLEDIFHHFDQVAINNYQNNTRKIIEGIILILGEKSVKEIFENIY